MCNLVAPTNNPPSVASNFAKCSIANIKKFHYLCPMSTSFLEGLFVIATLLHCNISVARVYLSSDSVTLLEHQHFFNVIQSNYKSCNFQIQNFLYLKVPYILRWCTKVDRLIKQDAFAK